MGVIKEEKMRILAVLRGIPGVGKTTWIKNNKLENYCLSPDDLRVKFAGVCYTPDGKMQISQNKDSTVWKTMFNMLEERMKVGMFTIIDATSTKQSDLAQYEKYCRKYRYRMVVVDFSGVDLDTCKARNKLREEWKCVPDSVLDKMYARLQVPLTEKYKNMLCSPDEFCEKYAFPEFFNADKYKKVVVFGDIHGCYSALLGYFEGKDVSVEDVKPVELNDDCLYIFTGDYIDRGTQNKEVIEFLYGIKDKENVVMLMGNHESNVECHIRGENIGYAKETVRTIQSFDDEHKKMLHCVVMKCRIAYCFEYDDKKYVVTHGGIPTLLNNFTISSRDVIKGVGEYSDTMVCDTAFSSVGEDFYSIHGHRNLESIFAPIHSTPRTYNLCDTIEFGGFLRIIEISKDGINEIKVKNNVYRKAFNAKYNADMVQQLTTSKMIKEKNLGNGISSYNFTREAFFDNKFDSCSIKARGLFLANSESAECGKVIARAYDKFFNVFVDDSWKDKTNDELEYGDCHLDKIKDKIQFPVTAYLKENGFLGILSWDFVNNNFFVASKSTCMGDFARYFRDIVKPYLTEKLGQYLRENDVSMVFEVVDMVNDGKHMVDYGENTKFVVLLDIVKNDFTNTFLPYDAVEDVAKTFGMSHKQKCKVFENFDDLKDFIYSFESDECPKCFNGKAKDGIEGFVFYDAFGYMFKYKTKFYRNWKKLRSIMERIKIGKSVDIKAQPASFQPIVDFMKNITIPEDMTIIQLRRKFKKL